MAKKISSFQELTDLSGDDYIPIIDDSEIQANMNKRVTIATLDSRYKVGTDFSLDNLDVSGDTSLQDVSINGSLDVSGTATFSCGTKIDEIVGSGRITASLTNFGSLLADDATITNSTVTGLLQAGTLNAGDTSLGDTSLSNVNVVGNLDVSGDTSLGNLNTGGPFYNTTFGDTGIDVGHVQINLNTKQSSTISSSNTYTLTINVKNIKFDNLPISDPGDSGLLWNDSGTLKISSGGAGVI